MLKQKLTSRKFWVTVATFVVGVIAIFQPDFAAEIDPQALAGLAGVIIAYLGGQSWIDKTAVDGQLKVARDEGLLQAQQYIQQLQTQLAAMNALQQTEASEPQVNATEPVS